MRLDLEALTAAALNRPLAESERVGVAVSGGPDSLALLLLAAEAWPGRTHALTVDHGLRPEAADEARTVGAICATLAVSHAVLRWNGPHPTGDVQAAAREARYHLMAGHCRSAGIGLLLTAHHADDQAETLLMRLARGSGVGGLAGIRAHRDLDGVALARPLLGVRKAALAVIVGEAGITAVDDPSNRDPRFDRTRVRRLLGRTPWLSVPRLAMAATNLADAETALAWAADRAWAGRAELNQATLRLDADGLPPEVVHRLLRRAIATLAPEATPRGDAIVRLAVRLGSGGQATLCGIVARGGSPWQFQLARARRGR